MSPDTIVPILQIYLSVGAVMALIVAFFQDSVLPGDTTMLKINKFSIMLSTFILLVFFYPIFLAYLLIDSFRRY